MPPPAPTVAPVALAAETLDRLAGDWWVFQLRRGHRYNTDDLVTAWTAARAQPLAPAVLDLGAGVGALGLLTLLRLGPEVRLTAVEAQPRSTELFAKTVAYNRLGGRVEILTADVRSLALNDRGPFLLVTANPPYLPAASATPSPHAQRAAARLELCGDVFDFCAAAARHLAPGGRFCFCHLARDPRPERAIARAGLVLLARQQVRFRADREPSLAVFTCGFAGVRHDPAPLSVRETAGARSEAFRALRREMAMES